MTHDVRYAPPQTVVEDFGVARRGPRPRKVAIAMRVLWASFALSVPSAVYPLAGASGWLAAVFALLFAFTVLLYLKLAAGRNWARIVLTALVALSLVAMASPVEPSPLALRLLEWSCLGLDVVALWLLFSRESSSWFRPRLVT